MERQHQGGQTPPPGGGGVAWTRAVAEVVAAVAELLQHVLAAGGDIASGRGYLHILHTTQHMI